MRFVLAAFVASLLASPAIAEPVVKTSMPAIRASVANDEVIVRMDQGVLGSVRSLQPRTLVVTGRDASGKVVAESTSNVSRRMTYARLALPPALAGASTVTVSVR